MKRARTLEWSLKRDKQKSEHFVEFMGRSLDNGHAELAPLLPTDRECWYLPIFGVYHAKKKDQIRVVFDSSAQHQGLSLNSVLLQGPDLTNNLLGVLMRFRLNPVAVIADIQQMFFQFRVCEKDRDFLTFLWFKGNNPNEELVEYRMCVHVFGNAPSPAVATFGLRKSVKEDSCDQAVIDYVQNNFYVDDGLSSFQDTDTAIQVLKSTQKALDKGGKLRLHKIASNSKEVLQAFPSEDLAKDLKDINIGEDSLPSQRSLGLSWNLDADCFMYSISGEDQQLTRRGLLSVVNSLYDPLGFIAPVVIKGKILMRDMVKETLDWDAPISDTALPIWDEWRNSLQELHQLQVPRTYLSVPSNLESIQVHIFSDASEQAVSAVAYMRMVDEERNCHVGFILGKSKVAPKSGHTIPRLELCAAVLAVELAEIIAEHLNIDIKKMIFHTDSQVVLGYLNNKTRRFYVYVQNRVSRILGITRSNQWHFVNTEDNPADQGTRPIATSQLQNSKWLKGPDFLLCPELKLNPKIYELGNPDNDKEIRPEVQTMKTVSEGKQSFRLGRFAKLNSWSSVIKVVALLKSKVKRFKQIQNGKDSDIKSDILKESETFIIKKTQEESFKSEIQCIKSSRSLPSNSSICHLNPWLDEHGILRVGGRLLNAPDLGINEKHPILLHKSHFVSRLIIMHYHQEIYHQGSYFTEGIIRSAGFWIIGEKRLIRSIIHKCVVCRKLRGKPVQQIMSDLPEDRLTPGPPFTAVGVDVFGPWDIVSRKTRGASAQAKRWAVLYTCYTCLNSRAIHIEVIEEMSTSSFINATRRFIAIRGPVKEFRSDRGSNFIVATDSMRIQAINVEDESVKKFFDKNKTTWIFNPPKAAHMGGVWERLIGVVRRILDSMLLQYSGHLTHEVMRTFMAEVCSIVNSRPLVPISVDHENPTVLSPMMLLTQKPVELGEYLSEISVKDMYKIHRRRVQCLSNMFWKRWRNEFLQTLQKRQKWTKIERSVQIGDVVLMIEDNTARNDWPMGIVTDIYESRDGYVRKVTVKVYRKDESTCRTYTRPITKLVMLVECDK